MSDLMKNYEVFKKAVQESFKDYLPDKYKEMDVQTFSVKKINITLDAIALSCEDAMSPTIYINDMYEQYLDCNDFDEVLQSVVEFIDNYMVQRSEIIPTLDFDKAKDNIVFQVINTEQNKEMLADIPHREFHDLSIIYRWIIKVEEEGVQSTIITNSLAEKLGIDEDQLFTLAVENTRRILPLVTYSLSDMIRKEMIDRGMPEQLIDEIFSDDSVAPSLYVITNARGINGAASMLYEDVLFKLSEQLDDDLYIMPSSIHEVLVINAKFGDPDDFAMMVSNINIENVPLSERLSNQVYYYDRNLRKVSLATDTPNKRLDGIIE